MLSRHELPPAETLLRAITAAVQPQLNDSVTQEKLAAAPRVSVIIPCYKLAHYLRGCVASVIRQTYQDFEIIIVNPSSPDNIKEVAEQLIRDYPAHRIRLVDISNYGQPACSRNMGIEQAQGEFILCLDGDDFIAPAMLEKTVAALEANPEAGIAFPNYQN